MLLSLIFPPKCTLCRNLLSREETDLCHSCRIHAPQVYKTKRKIPFIAQWTAIWYYKDDVRKSIQRYKFSNARSYADTYARLLAANILDAELLEKIDVVTWAPVSAARHFKRGYDQSELLAKSLCKELSCTPVKLLKKARHTKAQSSIQDPSQRRANIINAYRCINPDMVTDKRILLIDDVLTTGSTASECAKTLLTHGAKEVFLATIAVAAKK